MARLKRHVDRRGAALVEAALVLPILLILTFGVLEYGWMFIKDQEITSAARQGARIAATVDATNAQVQSAVSSIMSANGLGGSGYQLTFSPANVATVSPKSSLTVSISVTYSNIKLTGISWIPTPAHLGATITMSKEGP